MLEIYLFTLHSLPLKYFSVKYYRKLNYSKNVKFVHVEYSFNCRKKLFKNTTKNSDAQHVSKERFLSSSDENKRCYYFKSRRKAELAAPVLLCLTKQSRLTKKDTVHFETHYALDIYFAGKAARETVRGFDPFQR